MASLKKILFFCDDSEFANKFRTSLASNKFHVVTLNNPALLIQKVYDEMPHLILVDIHSSDVGTFDICAQMKYDMILGHIPMMVLTDSVVRSKEKEGIADIYLPRTSNISEMMYHIKRIFAQTTDELDLNPLTHLPGNRTTVTRIEDLIEARKKIAAVGIDIKNLKIYNDLYGVRRGDFLIRETAEVIKKVLEKLVSEAKFLGHLGGDDFLVICDIKQGVRLAEMIIEGFDKAVPGLYDPQDRDRGYMVLKGDDGQYHHYALVSLSIAIATNEVFDFEKLSDITKTVTQIHNYLRRFPSSAYLKDRRSDLRKSVDGPKKKLPTVASPNVMKYESNRKVKVNLGSSKPSPLLESLQGVLQKENVDTFYQAIMRFNEDKPFGYEALSRFPMPDGSMVDPARMFAAARESNVIRKFDVLCAQKALANADGLPSNQKLFINLNRETVLDTKSFEKIFEHTTIPLRQIVIEITEQSILRGTEHIISAISAWRRKGLQFAVDDMGGGSVSLREAASFKPDFIKFDASLVRDITAHEAKQKILISLIVFAKGIHARTTAEGIETKKEMHFLEEAGIDFGQGFYLHKPQRIRFTVKKS